MKTLNNREQTHAGILNELFVKSDLTLTEYLNVLSYAIQKHKSLIVYSKNIKKAIE